MTVTFLISLGCHPLPPEGVTPDFFYLSDLVCSLFFVNSATKIFFVFGRYPLEVSPGAVGPLQPGEANDQTINFLITC